LDCARSQDLLVALRQLARRSHSAESRSWDATKAGFFAT
jgi:hypothetical protein